jgi:hypothetical protein
MNCLRVRPGLRIVDHHDDQDHHDDEPIEEAEQDSPADR